MSFIKESISFNISSSVMLSLEASSFVSTIVSIFFSTLAFCPPEFVSILISVQFSSKVYFHSSLISPVQVTVQESVLSILIIAPESVFGVVLSSLERVQELIIRVKRVIIINFFIDKALKITIVIILIQK